ILLNGEPIHKTPPYEIVRKKIAMVPEGRQLFGRLSVLDNLLLGAYVLDAKEEVGALLESVLALFPRLAERKGQRAETLSGGEQQQLAIGRGLMSRPALLMLDEPSLGIMPKLMSEIFKTIHEISQKGVTVFLVEQNVYEALNISDRAYVLQTGRIVLEGKGKDLLKSDLVRKAYLGM
ncbi:MAG TPA: ABC transporter ATP-binding protein, partial [Candidatus Methylomirabilis sp.]